MPDPVNITFIDNIENELGGLVPTVYSSRKFIEYISKYLREEDGIQHEYLFEAGNKLVVNTVQVSENKTKITYAVNEGIEPSGSVTSDAPTAEYGKTYTASSIELIVNITKKSYPLSFIRWSDGVTPSIDKNSEDLRLLGFDDVYTQTIHNANAIGPEDTLIASGGTYEDIQGAGGTLSASISRRTRHFWGAVPTQDSAIDIHDPSWSTVLGNLGSTIPVNFGYDPAYFVLVTTEDVQVIDNGIPLQMNKTTVEMNPYTADLSYTKTYNVYIGTLPCTGSTNFEIK